MLSVPLRKVTEKLLELNIFFSFDVICFALCPQKQKVREKGWLIVVYSMVTYTSIAPKLKASFSVSSVLRHIASIVKPSKCVWGGSDHLKLTVC